jgi:hypothetical protein
MVRLKVKAILKETADTKEHLMLKYILLIRNL